jgi:hypothetical protein
MEAACSSPPYIPLGARNRSEMATYDAGGILSHRSIPKTGPVLLAAKTAVVKVLACGAVSPATHSAFALWTRTRCDVQTRLA